MLREYELVTIWNPDLGDEGVANAVERLKASIQARGGEVTDTNVWGRRKLAYFIKKRAEGHYVVMQLKLDAARAAELESQLNINEDVLRHLLVRTDE
jgi:small subunit ribosomal protein S6